MPSLDHEFPLDLIRHVPDLAVYLLDKVADTERPKYSRARCDSGDATTTAPPELRADSVVVCESTPAEGGDPVPVFAIIVECQTKPDKNKRFSWPAYTANLRARLRCPVILLVLTPSAGVARWCSETIDLGGGRHMLRPLALPLTALEPVTDQEVAKDNPQMTILAAMVHRIEDPAELDALGAAFASLDENKTSLYSDYVLAALSAVSRKYLEDTVDAGIFEPKTEFVGRIYREGKAEGKAEGEASGEAKSVLRVLDTRGIAVSDEVRERVTSCTDLDQLATWVTRAVTVSRAEELFD
ncbi:hypothetical protein [Murinocardiopsis flavida]|nr:hypothetical protein [Murinocardiopsis flavida]